MTSAERDARRLLDAALQATSGVTFISSTAQVWIADRLKTAQALLATSISNEGRQALVHVTRARDFVEAIEAPRLRECIEMALNALDGRSRDQGLGRGETGVPDSLLPVTEAEANSARLQQEAEAREVAARDSGEPKTAGRGFGLLLVAAAITAGLIYYARKE